MAALTLSACGARAASVSQAASPAATRTAATATTLTPPATTAAPALSSATPNPVSTQATVTSKCVTGIYDETSSVFYSMADLRRGATTGSDMTEAPLQTVPKLENRLAAELNRTVGKNR